MVGSGVCGGYGGITERSPDQYRLSETQRAGEETEAVSLVFRLICGVQNGARSLKQAKPTLCN